MGSQSRRRLAAASPIALVAVALAGAAWGNGPGAPRAVSPAAQPAAATAPDSLALRGRVRALASPRFAGRGNGSPEALAAAETIAGWFAAAGLAPGAAGGGWFQEFTLRAGPERPAIAGLPAENVLGRLDGRGRLAGRWIVVGGHYDHLGRTQDPPGGYYPGADDNASGVSVIVELARLLADGRKGDARSRRGILFAAFAGEEDGLQGSALLARELPFARDSLDAMIAIDGVGRLRDDQLYVGGTGTAAIWPGLLAAVDSSHGLKLEEGRGGWDASDHVSFNAVGVPVLFLMTGPHEQYHSPADDWPLVHASRLARVAAFARDLLVAIAERPGPIPYVAVAEPPTGAPRAQGDGRPEAGAPPARRSWLGVIPDFAGTEPGVRLAGVMPGSPAAAAGMAKDDVLVGFAGKPVATLAEYAAALRAHAPGDTITVEFLRGQERLTRRVVLAARR